MPEIGGLQLQQLLTRHCLLLDVQLGGISGIALHRRLLADGDLTPVICITAHDDPARRTEA